MIYIFVAVFGIAKLSLFVWLMVRELAYEAKRT